MIQPTPADGSAHLVKHIGVLCRIFRPTAREQKSNDSAHTLSMGSCIYAD